MIHDLRYAQRVLRSSPGFTAAAVFTLALGIGANSALFSVVNAVLLRPLPYRDPDTLVVLKREAERGGPPRGIITPAEFVAWRDQVRSVEHLTAAWSPTFALTGVEEPEEIQGHMVSANVFPLLGVEPFLGRRFLPEEYNPGAEGVVILSHRLWIRRFSAESGILGRKITLNGAPAAIIGILPAGLAFPSEQSELWAPMRLDAEQTGGGGRMRRLFAIQVFGRLKAGSALSQAQAEMKTLGAAGDPMLLARDRGRPVEVLPALEEMVSNIRPALLVLAASVGFILLIGCANVANLLLARAAARQGEIAVRSALGASRGRLVRQLLTESLLLASLGAAAGLLASSFSLRALVRFLSEATQIPRLQQVRLDLPVIAFTLALSIVTGIVFGLAPAWQASRADLSETLKQSGGRPATGRGGWLRNLLVVAEVALSLILLTGAGLMIRSVLGLQQIDLGFRPDHLLTMPVPGPRTAGMPGAPPASVVEQLLERLRRMPGVEAAGVVTVLPLGGLRVMTTFQVEGQPPPDREEDRRAGFSFVSADYFAAMGIRLASGRFFSDQDREGTPRVAIINETLARRFFPGQDPVGRHLAQGLGGDASRIVGLIRNVKLRLLDDDGGGFVYFPYLQAGNRRLPSTLVVRTTGDPLGRVGLLRDEVRSLDRTQVVPQIRTMEQMIASVISERRVLMILLICLAAVALLMAGAGVFGAISYTVSRRTHEIGVRVALGAQPADVLRMVVGQALLLSLIGVAAGAAASLALTRFLRTYLYGVTATDPTTFAAVAALLLAVAALAGYLPARRAAAVDPVLALRYE